MMKHTMEIHEANFEAEVLQSVGPVLDELVVSA